jgi:hypothetical protein
MTTLEVQASKESTTSQLGVSALVPGPRPLRVCIVTGKSVFRCCLPIENFLPKIDGVTRTLARLLEHLQLNGHEALVIAPDNGLVRTSQMDLMGTDLVCRVLGSGNSGNTPFLLS